MQPLELGERLWEFSESIVGYVEIVEGVGQFAKALGHGGYLVVGDIQVPHVFGETQVGRKFSEFVVRDVQLGHAVDSLDAVREFVDGVVGYVDLVDSIRFDFRRSHGLDLVVR